MFGQPVLVSELDAQAKIRELERHLEALKLQIAEREDADMGVDLVGLEDPVDGSAGQPPSAPGASGPAAEGVAPAAAAACLRALLHNWRQRTSPPCWRPWRNPLWPGLLRLSHALRHLSTRWRRTPLSERV